jgi:hexosaminidase
MIGWDEVLRPDLPKTVVVQSWRGQKSLADAARQGYRGILSSGYYLDLMWPAARHYEVDPLAGDAASLSVEEKSRILGGEACMWGEWITPENIDSHIWPRNAAIAERLWSPPSVTDVGSMYVRLQQLDWRLRELGLTDRTEESAMLHRMLEAEDLSPLRTLADVVEPVKDYVRIEGLKGPWDFNAPMNRLVDAVRPESEAARGFSNAVQTYIQSGYKDRDAEAKIRTSLVRWRDNDAKLRPWLQQSFLLNEVMPLSANLSAVATAGLTALDYLDQNSSTPEAWKTQQLAIIDAADKPQADLLLMVAAPVKELVEAAGRPPASTP